MIISQSKCGMGIIKYSTSLVFNCPDNLIQLVAKNEEFNPRIKKVYFDLEIDSFSYKGQPILSIYNVYPRWLESKLYVAGTKFRFYIYYDTIINTVKPELVNRIIRRIDRQEGLEDSLKESTKRILYTEYGFYLAGNADTYYLELFKNLDKYSKKEFNVAIVIPTKNRGTDLYRYTEKKFNQYCFDSMILDCIERYYR